MRRRDALKLGLGAAATAAVAANLGSSAFGKPSEDDGPTFKRLTIVPLKVELAPGVSVHTLAFDGMIPGPLLNRGAGLTHFELRNETASDTVVHSPLFAEPLITVSAHGHARVALHSSTVTGAGLKAYSAYCAASGTIARGAIAIGMESDVRAIACDQLHVLSIHRWGPRRIMRSEPFNDTVIAYDHVSFNDKLMSASEPIRVRYGDRVRFHFSNAGAARGVTLALPQHRFLVVALDGHRVPTSRYVERVYMGPGESIDAIVEMNRPGRWILGTTHREDRIAGLGRLVEYAGARGPPVESEYGIANWDYCWFGTAAAAARPMNGRVALPLLSLRTVPSQGLSDPLLFDPTPKSVAMPFEVSAGKRYQTSAIHFAREPQSLQLAGHEMELVSIAGLPTAGVHKDVLTLPGFTRIEFEFVARANEVLLAHSRQVVLG
jgi:hypothetical protein